jgi:hypothetical protein
VGSRHGGPRVFSLDFGVLIFLGTLPPARLRDADRRGVAGQAGGHHKGCTLLAPTMQAGQGEVHKELCTRREVVVGLVNQHRISVTRLMIQPQVQQVCTLDSFNFVYQR